MALTADELAFIRSKIGSADPPSDADLNTAFGRLGTKEAVAAEVLEGRLATILSGPQKFEIDGDVKIDYGAAAKGLRSAVDALRPDGGLSQGRLYRTDRER